jgi:hypothetical protein
MPLSIPWPLGGIPSAASATALALLDASEGHPFRAAVLLGDQLQLHALMQHGLGQDWHLEAQVAMPQGAAAVSLTGDQQRSWCLGKIQRAMGQYIETLVLGMKISLTVRLNLGWLL